MRKHLEIDVVLEGNAEDVEQKEKEIQKIIQDEKIMSFLSKEEPVIRPVKLLEWVRQRRQEEIDLLSPANS